MKKIGFLLFSFVFLHIASAQVRLNLEIEAPSFSRLFGIGARTGIAIVNETPYYGKIFSVKEEMVTMIRPGEIVYDRITSGFDDSRLPIVILFYADTSVTNFVGAASRDIGISVGHEELWEVRISDVRFSDGRSGVAWGLVNPFPMPDGQKLERGISFPTIQFKGTTAVQIVNVTAFDVGVHFNTKTVAWIKPGEVLITSIHNSANLFQDDFQIRVLLQFWDRGRTVGYSERSFSVSRSINTFQYLVEASDIRDGR